MLELKDIDNNKHTLAVMIVDGEAYFGNYPDLTSKFGNRKYKLVEQYLIDKCKDLRIQSIYVRQRGRTSIVPEELDMFEKLLSLNSENKIFNKKELMSLIMSSTKGIMNPHIVDDMLTTLLGE